MTKKRKQINPISGKDEKGNYHLTFIDFHNNKYALIDLVLDHKRNSDCTECQWTVAIVGFSKLNEIDNLSKNCLFKIEIELDLLGSAVTLLKDKHNFIEDITYKPDMLSFRGAVIVYCEPSLMIKP